MATGDLEGNLGGLLNELRTIKFPSTIDEIGLRIGDPICFLQLLHFVLLDYSKDMATLLLEKGFELRGKTDKKFIEAAFKALRAVLDISPVLTVQQILQQVLPVSIFDLNAFLVFSPKGFAERKLILLSEVIRKCKELKERLSKQSKLRNLKSMNPNRPVTYRDRRPVIERAYREESPLQPAVGKWINTGDDDFLEPAAMECRFVSEKTSYGCLDADGAMTEASNLLTGSRSDDTVTSKENDRALCRISRGQAIHGWDVGVCMPEDLAARDPTQIKPQSRSVVVSCKHSHDESKNSEMNFRFSLERFAEDVWSKIVVMEEAIDSLHKELSSVQDIINSSRSETGEETIEDLLRRLAQLETRVKFLEAERGNVKLKEDKSTSPSDGYRERGWTMESGHRESDRCASSRNGRIEDIIAELSQRQSTAEDFLRVHKHQK